MTRHTALFATLLLVTACTGTDYPTRNAAMPPKGFPGAASIPGATLDMVR